MTEELNKAKTWLFERINKIEAHKLTLDLFYYFQFFVLTVRAWTGSCGCCVPLEAQAEAEESACNSLHGSSVPDKHMFTTQLGSPCSLLDPADTLHLEGLGMSAPLPEMLVVARVVVALQHILKTSVARKLGANPAGEGKRQTVTLERHQHGTKGPILQTHSSHSGLRRCPECTLLFPP